MNLQQAIYSRRSVREYTAEAVDEASIRQLINAAVQAPSAVNRQPWSFRVVRDQALLTRISDRAKAHMLATTPAGQLSQHFQGILSDRSFNIFYHAPALILICSLIDDPWAVENCALAAENLMLTACAVGLGTCWIGFARGWLCTSEGKSALSLPATCVPVAPIIVGHPKSPAAGVHRKEPDIRWIDS